MHSGTGEPLVFGELLRSFRAAAGLTQAALAERAGLSVRGVSDLERGARREPFPATVDRLAAALGLHAAQRAALVASGRGGRVATTDEPGPTWPGAGLPVPLTSFVGREAAMESVQDLLATTRLLTLTGPGGIGKTRLAIEVARALTHSTTTATVLVELGPIGDSDMVASAIGSALGAREQPNEPSERALTNVIGSHRLRLVLDNCEHVIARSAELVQLLLQTCPGLRVLATSREPLGITGEVTWRVPPLSVPPTPAPGEGSALEASAAARLFLDRASAIEPDFRPTPQNAEAVAEICQRLDGIPLALELAAARLPALGVSGVAQRLDDRFRLLAHGSRTAPPRQRTLAATIDWSYALLNHRERTVFAKLSVFARGFTLEAAEAVCTAPDPTDPIQPHDVLDVVTSLVAKSLVVAGATTQPTPRYRLLETLRAYAAERLDEQGSGSAARDQHAAFFLTLAQQAEVALRGSSQSEWLTRLEQEHDNFRGALAWNLERGHQTQALELSAALTRFWLVRGYLDEGSTWLERALGVAPSRENVPARSDALTGAGILAWHRGDNDQSDRLLREALDLASAAQDTRRVAVALYELAKVASSRGDDQAARELAGRALDQWSALDDTWGKAATLNLLGELMREQRDFPRARSLYEESRRLFAQTEDQRGLAITSHNLGIMAVEQGAYARAIGMHRAALALKRELGDREGIICTLINLAWLAWRTGDLSNAPRLCGAADAARAAIGAALPVYERELYGRTLALARTALGESHCAAIEALGRTIDLDTAIAEALVSTQAAGDAVAAAHSPGSEPELSPRERQVAGLVARGLSNRGIADLLSVSTRTVESHVASSLSRLGLSSRAHLAAWAVEHGLTVIEPG